MIDTAHLLVGADRVEALRAASRDWPSWDLNPRQLCDLELLLNGGFSPLRTFMDRSDYEAVCRSMRLADGTLWPIPVVLDVDEPLAERLTEHSALALRDPEGTILAVMHVRDVWLPDRDAEAERVYGTTDRTHPGVAHLLDRTHRHYVTGDLEGLRLPVHYDFPRLRSTPAELRHAFTRLGWRRIVAFQTRNPMHRAHFEITLAALEDAQAKLLLHPSVGLTRPGDIDHYTRVRCYEALISRYPPQTAKLSLLPLAMRMAGPREALWHAIIRRNYGCTHLIVGRDHAGPGSDSDGKPFYEPYAAQALVREHEAEVGVTLVSAKNMVYVEDSDSYSPEPELPPGSRTLALSGTELRRRLAEGLEIPKWFTFPEVAQELRRRHPPRSRSGLTIFFTGLSAAGKSTIANVLLAKLLETGGHAVTLLDGDIVRKQLSSELGFSKEHRDINVRRIGFVAAEITKHGGIALCAPIAPYDRTRKEVRAMIASQGGFFLVHVATPLEVCEARDAKGLYTRARAGLIPHFTGITDPYEAPDDADVTVTAALTPEEAAQEILLHIQARGYLGGDTEA